MKNVILLLALYVSASFTTPKNITVEREYPTTFTILKTEYDKLFKCEINKEIAMPRNKYIDKSVIQLISLTGDMKFLRLKLNYFPKSHLLVQVNGIYSTQVFLASEDRSLYYKGTIKEDFILMTKCAKDDIVSE